MRFGSVCSGIEAASVAWEPLGWSCAFVAEIDPAPSAVLAHRFPGVPNLGDFTAIGSAPQPIDVLVGGTPCQSFSVAGLRGGMADARGNLALEFLRLAGRLRPAWVVWENVPGVLSSNGGRDFGAFLGGLAELGYGWAYRVLDAQHFGVPQRRRRVFVVGHSGDRRRAAAVLFERHSLSGNPPPRRAKGQGVAPFAGVSAAVSSGRGWWDESDFAATIRAQDSVTKADTLIARSRETSGGTRCDLDTETFIPEVANSCRTQDRRIGQGWNQTMVAHTLRADGFAANQGGTVVKQTMGVRRLSPLECERLQGFPDHWTAVPYRGKPMADGPRYKMIGNSMAVPVVKWIGQRLRQVAAIPALTL